MGTAQVALSVAAAILVIYATIWVAFYVGPKVILDSIMGNSSSISFKICFYFGLFKIGRFSLQLLYIATQHLFLKSLSSMLEMALGYKRL